MELVGLVDSGPGVEQVTAASGSPMALSGKWEWRVLLLRLTAIPCWTRGVLGSFRSTCH